jgi:hypothetical protein
MLLTIAFLAGLRANHLPPRFGFRGNILFLNGIVFVIDYPENLPTISLLRFANDVVRRVPLAVTAIDRD